MAKLRLSWVSGMLPMAMSGVKAKGCEEQWHIKQAKEKKATFLKPYRSCLLNSLAFQE